MKSSLKKMTLCAAMLLSLSMAEAQRKMVHPGITYTQADIDRMKAMVEAKQEPFYSGYLNMLNSRYVTYGDYKRPLPTDANGNPCIWANRQLWLDTFGYIALDHALLWKITGNTAYADKAVEVLNRYIPVKSTWTNGTNCLDNGSARTLIEAAELLRDYSGWKAEDQQGFKDFLVYPGYSSKEDYYAKYATSVKETNRTTIYWNVFQGDPNRHGNQGLYGMHCLMAMGIYLDNDTIYERALNKVLSMPHRSDDLPYPKGPREYDRQVTSGVPECFNTYSGTLTVGDQEDYGFDDELKYWIYENGQCQEASRDQGHIMDGMCNMTDIAKIAWNQGDDIFTAYNDRLLDGITYAAKYNYGWANNHYYDEAYFKGEEDFEPTVENGQFIQAKSRTGRWQALKINPWAENGKGSWSRGKRYYAPVEMLMAYKVRLGYSGDKVKWLDRVYDMHLDSLRKIGVTPDEFLEEYRTPWMAGDGGTFAAGRHVSGLPSVPGTIKAVDYDYFNNKVSGNGHTYYNTAKRTDDLYRTEGGMQIAKSGDDCVVTAVKDGSWMNYTFKVAKSGTYIISVNANISKSVTLGAAVDNSAEQTIKADATTGFSDVEIGKLSIAAGARVLRIYVNGADDAVDLKSITVTASTDDNATADYRWNSRDYAPIKGAGSFLTDRSDKNLYSTGYSSITQPTFTMASGEMNYRIATDKLYMVVNGTNLDHAAMKQATYRLTDTGGDQTKISGTGQNNHFKFYNAETGETELVWKLDSAVSSRITPLLKACYTSGNSDYVLRKLALLVYGSTVYLSTEINGVDFLTLQELKEKHPELYTLTDIEDVTVGRQDSGNARIYDLSGRQIKQPKKGIYIKNNKKYVVR